MPPWRFWVDGFQRESLLSSLVFEARLPEPGGLLGDGTEIRIEG